KLGAGSVFLSEFPSRGTFPSLNAAPVVKNPPQKAHKDPVNVIWTTWRGSAEVCTL
ncbi:Hypothetical protein FKW44_000062, partial [Caligus rogercresseyi]